MVLPGRFRIRLGQLVAGVERPDDPSGDALAKWDGDQVADGDGGYQRVGDVIAIEAFGGESPSHCPWRQNLRPHAPRAPSRITLKSASRVIIARLCAIVADVF